MSKNAQKIRLSDQKIRTVKPKEKPFKLFDGDGLYLEVRPNGSKWWRFRYRFGGKEKLLSMGIYPEVSLKEARDRCFEARKQVAAGINPGEERKQKAGADSFENVARTWFADLSQRKNWAPSHSTRILRRFERDVFPWIGTRPISNITPPELLGVFKRIESRGVLETAQRAKQTCGQVFRYAVGRGLAERDPTQDLRGAMPTPKEKHFAAITDPKQVGELLRALDGYQGHFITKCALRLLPLVFVRSSELRKAQWSEIDLEDALWRIPAERMKMRKPHMVPLSRQAVAILRELEPLTNRAHQDGVPCYVFPGAQSRLRPMSENAVLTALRRMGYDKTQMTGHGFRTTASTLLHELGWDHLLIETQLAHIAQSSVSAAYNFAQYLDRRREMMQAWADHLDTLKNGTK